ncbi:hypothetical protein BpHYR1_038612 [Brachionus plicatilis]|uniref:Uncharacterized protein n=1 Tax=Brachionus plicatilis TaxID=10195 RepID=A0A3M7QLV4_BRAPC|nr:hypothetical protein BpHYR1_038612 [Brachionus plicatilis]
MIEQVFFQFVEHILGEAPNLLSGKKKLSRYVCKLNNYLTSQTLNGSPDSSKAKCAYNVV